MTPEQIEAFKKTWWWHKLCESQGGETEANAFMHQRSLRDVLDGVLTYEGIIGYTGVIMQLMEVPNE